MLTIDLERLYEVAGNGFRAGPTKDGDWLWTYYHKLAAVETPDGKFVRAEVLSDRQQRDLMAHWRLPEAAVTRMDERSWEWLLKELDDDPRPEAPAGT